MDKALKDAFLKLATPKKKAASEWFFKTGPGEYGHGDVFLGLSVGDTRSIAKKFQDLSLPNIKELLDSKIHEHRLCGLIILEEQYKKLAKAEDLKSCAKLYRFYLANISRVNNWDLVDTSARPIIGHYWFHVPLSRKAIRKLSRAKAQWPRRIAMLASFYFIQQNELDFTYELAVQYMTDPEDLMHKATGWMLREAGKRDIVRLEKFVRQYAAHPKTPMPRTMLRYCIEKFPEKKRKELLGL